MERHLAAELTWEVARVLREKAQIQEILTNVARHAQTTKVRVHLGKEQEVIVLQVEDNGVGISPTRLAERPSLGLLGMRERAAALGGAVEIVGGERSRHHRDSSDACIENER